MYYWFCFVFLTSCLRHDVERLFSAHIILRFFVLLFGCEHPNRCLYCKVILNIVYAFRVYIHSFFYLWILRLSLLSVSQRFLKALVLFTNFSLCVCESVVFFSLSATVCLALFVTMLPVLFLIWLADPFIFRVPVLFFFRVSTSSRVLLCFKISSLS